MVHVSISVSREAVATRLSGKHSICQTHVACPLRECGILLLDDNPFYHAEQQRLNNTLLDATVDNVVSGVIDIKIQMFK